MLVGCLLTISGLNLPLKETMIALSLLIAGTIVLSGHGLSLISTIVLFTVFGLFHGSAFAESIVGLEGGVGLQRFLKLYFANSGLAGGWIIEKPLAANSANHTNARLCGAVVAGIGLLLTLEAIEGSLFSALGIG